MDLTELDYELPTDLIAQHPASQRTGSRLLVCRRAAAKDGAALSDRHFRDLPALLKPGDVLVRNDSRVLAARTWFLRPSGGRLEVLFLHEVSPTRGGPLWEVLVRGRPKVGETLTCSVDSQWELEVVERIGDGRWLVESASATAVTELLHRYGSVPVPPYIKSTVDDPERYQTTYGRLLGSAAAPTAGLHFTPRLDAELTRLGVQIVHLTLHVGLGTFRPLKQPRLEDNQLHAERFAVPLSAWQTVLTALEEDRRVIAVGTTTVRTLEHLALGTTAACDGVLAGSTELFITPGFRFQVVSGLITNFHLPRSSLLALVMAFYGVAATRRAYRHAVVHGYRFYSFGDAMVVV